MVIGLIRGMVLMVGQIRYRSAVSRGLARVLSIRDVEESFYRAASDTLPLTAMVIGCRFG